VCEPRAEVAGPLTTAAKLAREAVQCSEDAPAEAAAVQGPGSVTQGAAVAEEAGTWR
jgi:hypothetical protein